MKFSIIVAGCITENPHIFGIGYNGKLPWHIPQDLQFFKSITMNSTIIMGRITWESIGRPLPNRIHIVITSKLLSNIPSVYYVSNLSEAIYLANQINKSVFIIGGGTIYADIMSQYKYMCDTIYLTTINKFYKCDTWIQIPDIPYTFSTVPVIDTVSKSKLNIEFRKYTL